MSEIKHTFTPGPWTFGRWDEYGDARFYISQQEGAPYTPNYSDVATLIAETCSGERVAIQEANARLIAAAPELLALLVELVDIEGPCPGTATWAEKVHAAIAKATGSQS